MAWTFKFVPSQGKESIGFGTAIWSVGQPDEFQFSGSVSIRDNQSINDFVKMAKKAKAYNDDLITPPAKIKGFIDDVTTKLNAV